MTEKFVDTREQLLAQSYDRHLSVNANAGSGKTTVLQKRFVSLLLDDKLKVEPRELVAITFTRKAASEIFAKIAKAIEEIIQNPLTGKTQHAKLIRIRERLNSARISTIHSFCSSMIRDFPVESGIPPNFSELSTAENIVIVKDSIIDTLTDYLNANDSNSEMLKHLISSFGKRNLESLINKILNKKDILPKIQKYYEDNSDEEINYIAISGFLNFLNENYFDSINDIYGIFDSLTKLNLSLEQTSSILAFQKILFEIILLLKNIGNDATYDNSFNFKFKEISNDLIKQKILTQNFLLNSTTFKKLLNEDLEVYNSELEKLQELVNFLSCLDNTKHQSDLIIYSRFILELTMQVNDNIEYKKQDSGSLDFDDILIKAQKMLENKDVSEKISKRYRYLMVDEFQDTNEIQYDIIKSLVPQLTENSLSSSLNLFIVGDPKQSIYGFRNADVRVFKKATEDIKNCNQILIQNNQLSNEISTFRGNITPGNNLEILGELGLTVSFRHLPVITAFTNIVCSTVMNRKDSEFDVEYSKLICSKRIPELTDFLNSGSEPQNLDENLFGSVKLLISEKAEKDNQDVKMSEAEMLAVYLRNLIASTNYRYSDVAILSRARTKFNELANALQKYSIPYVLHSGKGFYQAQEVIDMISILRFLHNPGDDLALTAALRSPYFGMSDSQIIMIVTSKKNTVFEKLEFMAKSNIENEDLIVRTYDILSKLLLYSTRLSISHLIGQVIEICGWYGSSAASSGRSQVTANLLKLKQFASDFEKRGFKTLFDFVEEVNLMSNEDMNESEAVFITDDNAVNIMTIHAAKGLEFPVVVLFNSYSGRNNNGNSIIDESLGLGFKVPYYNQELKEYEQIETPLYLLAKSKSIFKEKAELKRLLYVALTRAKEHLIITADLNYTKSNSLFDLILQGLSVERGMLPTGEINLSCDLKTYHDGIVDIKNINFQLDVITDIELTTTYDSILKTHVTIPEILMDDIKSEISDEIFSASRIIKFIENKDAYFGRYVLGFDDDFNSQQSSVNSRQSTVDNGQLRVESSQLTVDSQQSSVNSQQLNTVSSGKHNHGENITGAEEGTIIHYLMENISRWYVDMNIDNRKLELLLEEISLIIHKDFHKEFKERIIQEITNVVSTELIKNNFDEILNSKHEAEFNIPILDDFLNAKIDLLFEKDSIFEVWDWKSNIINSKDEMKELAGKYEFQMKVYTYLVMLLQPEFSSFKARLLFTKLAQPDVEDNEWTFEFVWTKEDLLNFKTELENKIIQIKCA